MKLLIYGAGTIGTAYGWLVSCNNEVDFYGKSDTEKEITISYKDLRKRSTIYQTMKFERRIITHIEDHYDAIIVAVNRFQLCSVLPHLKELKNKTKYFVFMQNNWNIKNEIDPYLSQDDYLIAFPSSIGGGRDEKGLHIIIFDEATRLGGSSIYLPHFSSLLQNSSINITVDKNIFEWLKVHYLQQAITAGVIAEYGRFENVITNPNAIKKMVLAFREGIQVCRLLGVRTYRIFPAYLFNLPVFLITRILQKMFSEQNTLDMIINHMKKGYSEWVVGYKEVLNAGRSLGLPMSVWGSYEKYIDLT